MIRTPDLTPIGDPTSHDLSEHDRSLVELIVRTTHPTLAVTGPRRLPQARTNTRWTNSLAVPVATGGRTVGVVYATRLSTEAFTEEDLHWLTAYTSTAARIFL